MSSDRRTAVGSALIAVVLVVSGCGSGGIPLREDPQLLARAQQVIRDGAPVSFRELAGGDWDRVHVFPGPPSLHLIESDLGAAIVVSGSYTPYDDGGVIVFTKRGVVQRAVRLEPYPFDGDRGSYGRHVLVQRPHSGAGSLELVDISTMRATRLR
ncbi:MAG: hypothetical protein ACRDSL_02430 [Pseudonocardiaceae bacterium]